MGKQGRGGQHSGEGGDTREDPKTVVIDTAAVAARQRGRDERDIPKTVAVDAEQLARRAASAKRQAEITSRHDATRRRLLLAGAVVVLAVLAYLLAR